MPSSKRQRTMRGSSASSHVDSERSGSESPRPHKSARRESEGNKENHDPAMTKEPALAPGGSARRAPRQRLSEASSPVKPKKHSKYEYICFHRPRFDVDGENWRKWSEGKAERLEEHELSTQLYQPIIDEEDKKGIWRASPSDHKDHKWVIMQSAWQWFELFCRKSLFSDSGNLHLRFSVFSEDWDMQEIVDSAMIDFDKAFLKKDASRIDDMWAITTAIGLWLNHEDISAFMNNKNSEKTCELVGLIGCALLTALSAIDRIGQLKPDSRFLDLALVIGYYLELSHDLPAFGIDVSCMSWRKEAGLLFKKGKLDFQKGLFDTDCRLKELENTPDAKPANSEPVNSDDETEDEDDLVLPQLQCGKGSDPWDWSSSMRKYREKYGDAMMSLWEYKPVPLSSPKKQEFCLKRKTLK